MSLEAAARTELLQMRKHRDGVTVAALARTDAIRQVLGGGDPRVAYNALKHILLNSSDDLAVTAAAYSLGFASDGATHLDRLIDFGREHGYDQRQARRYSDRGTLAVARHIGSEWVLQASPVLRVRVLRWDTETLDVILQTERHPFIEMREPEVQVVTGAGLRRGVECDWTIAATESAIVRASSYIARPCSEAPPALSVLWPGELWPKFEITTERSATESTGLAVESLAARLQLSLGPGPTRRSDIYGTHK